MCQMDTLTTYLFLLFDSIDQLFKTVQNGERREIGHRIDQNDGVRAVDVVFDGL